MLLRSTNIRNHDNILWCLPSVMERNHTSSNPYHLSNTTHPDCYLSLRTRSPHNDLKHIPVEIYNPAAGKTFPVNMMLNNVF